MTEPSITSIQTKAKILIHQIFDQIFDDYFRISVSGRNFRGKPKKVIATTYILYFCLKNQRSLSSVLIKT